MTATPHRRHTRVKYADCPACQAETAAKAAVHPPEPVEEDIDTKANRLHRERGTRKNGKPRAPIGTRKPRTIVLAPDKGIEVAPVTPEFDLDPGEPEPEPWTAPADPWTPEVEPAREGETREEWMIRAANAMRPWFPEDATVPPVRVSVGWPAGRGSSRLIGQCWYSTDDSVPALFVSPALNAESAVLDTLLHEMVHAAVGAGQGHKGKFVTVAKALGFTKPWRSTPCSPELQERIALLAAALGPFPHARVSKASPGQRPEVQSTRMLKVVCDEDGYMVRTTRKWLDVGLPTCPDGHEMHEEV